MKARLMHPEWDLSLVWLTKLYAGYVSEEARRLRDLNVPGYPTEWTGRTALLWLGDTVEPDGFVYLDEGGRTQVKAAIEMTYVRPEARRKGLLTWWIGELRTMGYANLTIKAPLSPAGEALSKRFGFKVDEPTEEEAAVGAAGTEMARRAQHVGVQNCRSLGHKRGNPSMPCQKCLKSFTDQVAAAVMMNRYAELRSAWQQTGSYWPWLNPDRQARYLGEAV